MPRLMEVLEYLDDMGDMMVVRVPPDGACEIKWGAQLTVRESQNAVFFRDGKALATFKPGRHILKTQNIPILTKFVTWFGYGPDSPFRSEVYFVNMKLFRNMKWGTPTPIPFRDAVLHMVRLRAFGIYSTRIVNPSLFLNRMVGTEGRFRSEEIEDYLRNLIVAKLIDILGESVKSIFDLPKNYNEIGIAAKAHLGDEFAACGLELVDFVVNSVTTPEEVQKMIDERGGMAAIGDMNAYVQFKAAKAMQDAAQAGQGAAGGAAGAGVGLGAGLGMGMMIPGIIQNALKEGAQRETSQSAAEDSFGRIKKLKELLDIGAITKEEFEAKKADLLSKV